MNNRAGQFRARKTGVLHIAADTEIPVVLMTDKQSLKGRFEGFK